MLTHSVGKNTKNLTKVVQNSMANHVHVILHGKNKVKIDPSAVIK
jgi:hypothetical protein